jgi:hypothetical protein
LKNYINQFKLCLQEIAFIAQNMSLSSQLGPQDIGIPTTPEQRDVKPIDEAAFDQGYDSEGLQAPWEEAEELDFDGPEFDEDPLPFGVSPVSSTEPNCQNITEDICTIEEAEKMKVAGLKDELKKRGLDVRGKKDELKARLKEAIEQKLPFVDNTTKTNTTNLAGDTFSPGAYWEELECKGEYVDERTLEGFRAPTVPVGEISSVRKRNFDQKFDRMVFSGKTELPKRHKNGTIAKDKQGNTIYHKQKPHNQTEVNMDFI